MPRKITAFVALPAVALLPLSGCAAAERPTLDYLKGTWVCAGGTTGELKTMPLTAHFDGKELTFESDSAWELGKGLLPVPPNYAVSDRDGLTMMQSDQSTFTLDLPKVMPEDGTVLTVGVGDAASGLSESQHFTAIFDGPTLVLSLDDATGTQVWDIGECVKQ